MSTSMSGDESPRIPRRLFFCDDPTRRAVACGGGVAALALILGDLLGSSASVRAEALSGGVPELDKVTVRIVTDWDQFAVGPAHKEAEGIRIDHFGWGLRPDHPPGKTLVSEFGLSMHVETQTGGDSRQILVDYGYTPEALNNNLSVLGIQPNALDALVLSHGHYDHFGGLAGFLRKNSSELKPGLPFFVGGEDCFCARDWTAPPAAGDFGVIDREGLKEAKLSVTSTPQPSLVGGHGFTSGRIGQNSFETLKSPSAMKLGIDHGSGCYADRFTDDERKQKLIPDQFNHEIATAFNLKGKGLIVLTSCSHRGVVNAVKEAQEVSGVKKVHAVIGGFHLAPYPPEYLKQTVMALKEINPNYIIPLHCSGEAFLDLAKAEMGPKFIRAYTGTTLTFA